MGKTTTPTTSRHLIHLTLACWLLLTGAAHAAGAKPVGTLTLAGEDGLAGIPIVAFQWSAKGPTSAGAGGAGQGKVTFDPFTVTKLIDATSPALLNLTLRNRTIGEVRIDLTIRRGTTASYVLSDAVIIVNDRHSAEQGGPPLQALAFSARTLRETVVTAGGTVTTCFGIDTQSACE